MNVSTGAKPRFQFSISKDDNYNVVGGMYETFSPKTTGLLCLECGKLLLVGERMLVLH